MAGVFELLIRAHRKVPIVGCSPKLIRVQGLYPKHCILKSLWIQIIVRLHSLSELLTSEHVVISLGEVKQLKKSNVARYGTGGELKVDFNGYYS